MDEYGSYKERARRPRIRNAAEFADLLDNVRAAPRGQYDYTADAPCHTSKNPGYGNSFHFGDAPGGGIVMGCWSGCLGNEMAARIEDRLGISLLVRWPNGSLRYRDASAPDLTRRRHRPPKLFEPDNVDSSGRSSVRFHATAGPDIVTLQDVKRTEIWFVR